MTTTPTVRSHLERVSWLKPVQVQRALAIYEVAGFDGPLGLPREIASRLAGVRFEHPRTYVITFRPPVTVPAGTQFALSHSRDLRLEAQGQHVAGKALPDGRLSLDTSLDQVTALTIAYVPSRWSRLASGASAVAMILILIQLVGARPARLLRGPRPGGDARKASDKGVPRSGAEG